MKRWLALLLLGGLAWGQGYVVQPGDTLERIARMFQINVADLMMVNGLIEDPLPTGLELAIPTSDWDPMSLEVLPLPEPPPPVEEALPWVFISPPVAPEDPKPLPPPVRSTQQGWASWYGPRFHGRRTANGERFNKFHLTAAHRTLPFGTRVRVTNLQNGRSIVVRINDRGPYIQGRIIDLSYAAARQLDMHHQGIIQVKVEILN